MAEKLYTILELSTNGWHPVSSNDVQLTKEKCDERLQYHLDDGVPVDRLKAVVDSRDLTKETDSTYQQYAGPSSTDSVK